MGSVQVDHIHDYNDYSQAPRLYFRQKHQLPLWLPEGWISLPDLSLKKPQVEERATQLSNHQALHYEEWLPAV